jgi:hypothetical protein
MGSDTAVATVIAIAIAILVVMFDARGYERGQESYAVWIGG